jgi:hypothetical protein
MPETILSRSVSSIAYRLRHEKFIAADNENRLSNTGLKAVAAGSGARNIGVEWLKQL